MKKSTAFLGILLVAAAVSSCNKETEKPGSNNAWILDGNTHVAKSVTAYSTTNRIAATDGQSVVNITFFGKLPESSGTYKVANYFPTASDEISVVALTETKAQYISRSNDSSVRAIITVTDGNIQITMPKVWVVATPGFQDSVQISTTLKETMRLK